MLFAADANLGRPRAAAQEPISFRREAKIISRITQAAPNPTPAAV
jgi:hypothetical protein